MQDGRTTLTQFIIEEPSHVAGRQRMSLIFGSENEVERIERYHIELRSAA